MGGNNGGGSDECMKKFVSIAPCTLPHGLITTHEISPSKDRTLVEVNRFKGDVIIDHCWMKTTCAQKGESEVLILAVLTRIRGQNIASFNDGEKDYDGNASTLHIQWREHQDLIGSTRRHSVDEVFPYRKAITLPLNATSIAMNTKLLVIGSSVGAIFFKLDDLVIDHNESKDFGCKKNGKIRYDSLPSLRILNAFVIHAMDISASYFVAVSGERLGVWSVSKIMNAFEYDSPVCVAEWSIKLEGQSRVTCIRFSITDDDIDGTYIVLCSWDGSAVVFRGANAVWNRVIGPVQNDEVIPEKEATPIWERSTFGNNQNLSPIFVEIIESNDVEASAILMVSAVNSTFLRLYDIESGRCGEIITNGNSKGETIQGIARLQIASTEICGFVCIDCNDKIEVLQIETIRNALSARSLENDTNRKTPFSY
jgi:hypothetical protein